MDIMEEYEQPLGIRCNINTNSGYVICKFLDSSKTLKLRAVSYYDDVATDIGMYNTTISMHKPYCVLEQYPGTYYLPEEQLALRCFKDKKSADKYISEGNRPEIILAKYY